MRSYEDRNQGSGSIGAFQLKDTQKKVLAALESLAKHPAASVSDLASLLGSNGGDRGEVALRADLDALFRSDLVTRSQNGNYYSLTKPGRWHLEDLNLEHEDSS